MSIQFDALTHGFRDCCQSLDERVDRRSMWRSPVCRDGDGASLVGNTVRADIRIPMCQESEGGKGADSASGGDQRLDRDVVVGLELDPRYESSSSAGGQEVGAATRAACNPGLTGVVRDLVGSIYIPGRGDQVQRFFQQRRLRDMLEPDIGGVLVREDDCNVDIVVTKQCKRFGWFCLDEADGHLGVPRREGCHGLRNHTCQGRRECGKS